MATSYEQAHAKYRELLKASANGDAKAKAEKAKVMADIRSMEREASQAGTKLSAIYRGDEIVVEKEEGRSKRSLQEEYVGKFKRDEKLHQPLEWAGKKYDNLHDYHKARLLGK